MTFILHNLRTATSTAMKLYVSRFNRQTSPFTPFKHHTYRDYLPYLASPIINSSDPNTQRDIVREVQRLNGPDFSNQGVSVVGTSGLGDGFHRR